MKQIIFLLVCSFICSNSFAGVRALGGEDDSGLKYNHRPTSVNSDSNNIGTAPIVNLESTNTSQSCIDSGFTMEKCPANYIPVYPCPLNNRYFRDCCPQEYRFSANNCYEKGMIPSVESCLGFHSCLEREEETPASSSNGNDKNNGNSSGKNKLFKNKNKS